MKHAATLILVTGVLLGSLFVAPPTAAGPATSLEEKEPNDMFRSAQEVPADCIARASVKSGGDQDHFRFKTEKPTFLRVSVTAAPGVDFTLNLADTGNRYVVRLNGQDRGKPEEFVQRVRRDTTGWRS